MADERALAAARRSDPRGLRFAVRTGGALAIGIGLVVLLGWSLEWSALKTFAPGWQAMKANTAVCLVLLGIALLVLAPRDPSSSRTRVGIVLAAFAALVGLLTLLEHAAGRSIGIDQLLFEDPSRIGDPGRMSVTAAAGVAVLGAALVFLDRPDPTGRLPGILALSTAILSVTVLAGYVFGVPYAVELRGLATVAPHTLVALFALAMGVVAARPEGWLVERLASRGSGGFVARWLLPAGVVVPIVVGALLLAGHRLGHYGTELGLTLMVGTTITLFVALVLAVASRLDRLEQQSRGSEAAARSSREALDSLVAHAPEGIVVVDGAGTIVRANQEAERMFGYEAGALLGRSIEDLVPERLRSAHAAHRAAYLRAPVTRRMAVGLDLVGQRMDGTTFPADITLGVIETDVPRGPLIAAFVRDVTERVRAEAELRAAHEELAARAAELDRRVEERTLYLKELNAELETFAYSVSHDLRAPLRAMDGFSRILLEEHAGDLSQEARGYLHRVREAAQRMARLIDDLLEFSRLGRAPIRRQTVQTEALVREVVAELVPADNGSARVVLGELPPCRADPGLLKQVFSNLIDNGLKFTRGREGARIEIGSRLDESGRVVYFVSDNGIGFDMAYAEKVFGVFQRLHRREEFEGTGVGLATVQRIVHRHGGRIWAEAAPMRGATFSFVLGGDVDEPDG